MESNPRVLFRRGCLLCVIYGRNANFASWATAPPSLRSVFWQSLETIWIDIDMAKKIKLKRKFKLPLLDHDEIQEAMTNESDRGASLSERNSFKTRPSNNF